MPCSAEIEPPYLSTTLLTASLISSPSRKELRAVGADRLADIEMHIAIAEMPERNGPASGNEGFGGGARFFQELRNRCDWN